MSNATDCVFGQTDLCFEVKDLQQVREPPTSKREAPSPRPKSKRRILDLSSSPLKTRSKPSDENDVPKVRNRKINQAEATDPIKSSARTSPRKQPTNNETISSSTTGTYFFYFIY